jgi:hypothetical protein
MFSKVYEATDGRFYDISHYDTIISSKEKEYQYGFNDRGEVLFCLIRDAISQENREKYRDAIRTVSRSKTKNRGKSAGPCDLKYFPPKAVALCDKLGNEFTDGQPRYSVYYKEESGKVVNRCQSNQVRCGVAGHFEKIAGLPCRKVGFSNKNPLKHEILIDLAKEIEEVHRTRCETSYKYHREKADECPAELLFKDTIYSTMTLNYDFRTACHSDKGDLVGGLSTLTILEDCPENYTGFYLGLPEYKIAFDIRDGDTLIFNAHEKHANTEYKVLTDRLPVDTLTKENYAGRIAIVCYLRDKLNRC